MTISACFADEKSASTFGRVSGGLLAVCAILALAACNGRVEPVDEQVVYDFARNLPLAKTWYAPFHVDMGTPQARRHLISGWSWDETFSGREDTFVWSVGDSSIFEFFLASPRAIELTARCYPFVFPDAPAQSVTIVINERDEVEFALETGSKDYTVDLPERSLKPGLNRLEFRYAYAKAPSEVLPGFTDERRAGVAWDSLSFGGQDIGTITAGDDQRELAIPLGAQADFLVWVSADQTLVIDGIKGPRRSALTVLFQGHGGGEQVLADLAPSDEPIAIPLEGVSPQIARVSFRARSTVDFVYGEPVLTLSRPVLRTTTPVARQDEARRPNIIVYLVDTLRADHLGCYGYSRPLSPNIDAFAEDSLLYTNAIAQSGWTKPAIASIFTGVGTHTHGMMLLDDVLPSQLMTMAEILQSVGYKTATFVTNDVIDSRFGFERGFRDAVYPVGIQERRSDQLNEHIFEWLERHSGDEHPFFLYIHTMDPHTPYSPVEWAQTEFAGKVASPEVGAFPALTELWDEQIPVTDVLTRDLTSLYDAEIAFNDRHFGSLVAELKRRDLYDESLILFVSDHGEAFYEHERWSHGGIAMALYQEVLRIPLILKLPATHGPGGREVAELAQQIDILPTILTAIDVDTPAQVEGHHLLRGPAYTAHGTQTGYAFMTTQDRRHTVSSVVDGPLKLIREWKEEWPGPKLRMFNLEEDPGEQHDLASRFVSDRERLLAMMESNQTSRPAMTPDKATIDEELKRKLRALGYIR